jgi:hypothetical protein
MSQGLTEARTAIVVAVSGLLLGAKGRSKHAPLRAFGRNCELAERGMSLGLAEARAAICLVASSWGYQVYCWAQRGAASTRPYGRLEGIANWRSEVCRRD